MNYINIPQRKSYFLHTFLFLIKAAYRCLIQQLTEVFRMVTIKEREDSVQPRNKINLRALKIQNGFHMSLILLSTLLTNHAFAKLYVWLRLKLSIYAR